MTQFQREIAWMVVLLTFFFGYSVYVETARIGMAGKGLLMTTTMEPTKKSKPADVDTIVDCEPHGRSVW